MPIGHAHLFQVHYDRKEWYLYRYKHDLPRLYSPCPPVQCHNGLEIGEHALLAQNVTLTPYSHKFEDPNSWIITQGGHSKKVIIGKDVYIGMGVCIMYSGDIGDGSVIGAGAVVVKPIPPYSVAVGNPARVIKDRK